MATKEYSAIWLQAAGCTGCSVSLLNVINPSIKNLLVDEVIPGSHINLRFHATVMAGAGAPAIQVMADTSRQKKGGYILIVEGAIPTAEDGIHGVIGEKDGKPLTMQSWVETLAKDALAEARLESDLRFVENGEELLDFLQRRGSYAGGTVPPIGLQESPVKDQVQAAPVAALLIYDGGVGER